MRWQLSTRLRTKTPKLRGVLFVPCPRPAAGNQSEVEPAALQRIYFFRQCRRDSYKEDKGQNKEATVQENHSRSCSKRFVARQILKPKKIPLSQLAFFEIAALE